MRLMKEIQQELHLDRPPLQIECFDNSNIQGSDAVAACVVFKKAKPSKKDYRKYNIKTVVEMCIRDSSTSSSSARELKIVS